MNHFHDEDPFNVIKNYRKLQARRRRYHKKRKPKCYPPTTIKTRSMEQRMKFDPQDGLFDWEQFSQMIGNSSQLNSIQHNENLMVQEVQEKVDRSMQMEALSLGEEQKPLEENSRFFFWNNEDNNDVNELELLQIH